MTTIKYTTDRFILNKNTSKNSKSPDFIGEVKRNGHTEYVSLWLRFDRFGAVASVSGNISQLNKDSDESMFLRVMEGADDENI